FKVRSRPGIIAALQFYGIMLLGIIPLNMLIDYSEGSGLGNYFSIEFIMNFASHPFTYGTIFVLTIISTLNQYLLVKHKGT
ncbi:hypothetical protein, partial [Pseudoalteromonas sp. BMB]|uniref:hypothetical protein n=1 Tax=Pseudoalteromonas sp. BMB TaxID=1874619 RepID=UPI001C305D4D